MRTLLCLLAITLSAPDGTKVLFEDNFQGGLGEGWSWVREQPEGWRTTAEGLEILVEPGNMWGKENSGKNVLLRPVPEQVEGGISASVQVENQPSFLYEQVDLVWYYNDSHMVKIGLELVHDQLSLVMGREEMDQAQTLAIIPLKNSVVGLKLSVEDGRIRGHYRIEPEGEWQYAGTCTLPAQGKPFISIQAYRGADPPTHWAKIRHFSVWSEDTAAGKDKK